jgi:hypothetical protein
MSKLIVLQKKILHAKQEMILTRDWKTEAHLRFVIIDAKAEISRLKKTNPKPPTVSMDA